MVPSPSNVRSHRVVEGDSGGNDGTFAVERT